TFSVFFRAGLADGVWGALSSPLARTLDAGAEPLSRAPHFAEHLRPHDKTVTPLLQQIVELVRGGIDDEMLYEQKLLQLLECMACAEHDFRRGAESFEAARSATRAELHR